MVGRNLLISMVSLDMFVLVPEMYLRLLSSFSHRITKLRLGTCSAVPGPVKEAGAGLCPTLSSLIFELFRANSSCIFRDLLR